MASIDWAKTSDRLDRNVSMRPISYTCGYCDRSVASDHGYYGQYVTWASGGAGSQRLPVQICICPNCNHPTYFAACGEQTPQAAFGAPVEYARRDEVRYLYDEARACMKVGASTAAAMCCRKLLMNVAVSEGAKEGQSYASYVRYLADEGHIPPKAAAWVDHIRDKGNEANHEIRIMERDDAERLIKFSEMLLRIMYEYPAEVEEPS